MSTTSDDMKKGLTFRKFKDGETSQYRKGSEWIEERFAGARMPHLRTTAGHDKVRVSWAGVLDGESLAAELAGFRAALASRRSLATAPPAEYVDGAH